jgi:hypothetical protein
MKVACDLMDASPPTRAILAAGTRRSALSQARLYLAIAIECLMRLSPPDATRSI